MCIRDSPSGSGGAVRSSLELILVSFCLQRFTLCVFVCQGFVSVHCQEKCVVEFHRDCWTLQKSAVLDVRLDKVDAKTAASCCRCCCCGQCVYEPVCLKPFSSRWQHHQLIVTTAAATLQQLGPLTMTATPIQSL